MASNKIQLKVDLYENRNELSTSFGKWFGKAVRQATLSTRGLADHIASHGSIYTLDVVEGVLRKISTCIPELVAQGVAVKIDGMGTFYPTLENKKGGAATVADFSTNQNIKGVHVRFQPDGTSLDNITSRVFKEKCQLETRCVAEITGTGKNAKTKLIPIEDYVAPAPNPGD